LKYYQLLDYKPLLNLCCSNNPFNFIRNNDSLKAIIIQLKKKYLYIMKTLNVNVLNQK